MTRIVRNLARGVDRVHIGNAIRELGQQGHRQHRYGAGRHQHRSRFVGHGARRGGHRGNRHDKGQRRGAVQRHTYPVVRRHGSRLPIGGKRHKYWHRADKQQGNDEAHQQRRFVEHRHKVDLRTGHHEEQRHEEAEGGTVELVLKVMVARRDNVAEHETCGERAQHRIELEHRRKRNERHQQQHRNAHGGLRGAVRVLGKKAVHAAAGLLRLCRNDRRNHRNGGECKQNHEGLPLCARGEQQRHGDDGAKLTPGTVGKNRIAHLRAYKVALLQNGHKRTQGRGAQGNCHGNAAQIARRMGRRNVRNRSNGPKAQRKAHQPGCKTAFPLMACDVLRVYLEAGQEEQKRQAKLRKQADGIGKLDDAGHVGPQQRARYQQEHRFRNGLLGDGLRNNRAKCRNQNDNGKRYKLFGHRGVFRAGIRFAPLCRLSFSPSNEAAGRNSQ